MLVIPKSLVFDWDDGNTKKNWFKHRVSDEECESVFASPGTVIKRDRAHSTTEKRFIMIGKTKSDRLLFIVFSIREHKVRVISARDISKKKKRCFMKKPLIMPDFENEDQERDFWSEINLADYYEPSDFEPVSFPNLKPSSRSISIRLPLSILDGVKKQANAMDVPYQSLIKHTLYNEFVANEPRVRYQAGTVAKNQKNRKSKSNQSSPYLKTKKSPGS